VRSSPVNLVTGRIVEIYTNGWAQVGKVRVSGVNLRVPLILLEDPRVGDTVLVSDGVAIAVVHPEPKGEN
jgi:hydrogenase maturation factor